MLAFNHFLLLQFMWLPTTQIRGQSLISVIKNIERRTVYDFIWICTESLLLLARPSFQISERQDYLFDTESETLSLPVIFEQRLTRIYPTRHVNNIIRRIWSLRTWERKQGLYCSSRAFSPHRNDDKHEWCAQYFAVGDAHYTIFR